MTEILVPTEPTRAMLDAGAKEMARIQRRSGYLASAPRDVWLAMVAALSSNRGDRT